MEPQNAQHAVDWTQLLLGLAALLLPMLSAWAAGRGKRELAQLLDVIVQGVEKSQSQRAKDAIQEVAQDRGLEEKLRKVVAKATDPPTPPEPPASGTIAKGLLLAISLALASSGCAPSRETRVLVATAASTADGDLREWDALPEAKRKRAFWKLTRALHVLDFALNDVELGAEWKAPEPR